MGRNRFFLSTYQEIFIKNIFKLYKTTDFTSKISRILEHFSVKCNAKYLLLILCTLFSNILTYA